MIDLMDGELLAHLRSADYNQLSVNTRLYLSKTAIRRHL